MQTEQQIPYDLQAERTVLGCCLLDRSALLTVLGKLKGGDFYHPPHRIVFDSISALFANKMTPDYVTLTNALMRTGDLEAAGGAEMIAGLTNLVPSVRAAEQYARVIVEMAQLRSLMRVGNQINAQVGAGKQNSNELVEWTIGEMIQLNRRTLNGRMPMSIDSSIIETEKRAHRIAEGTGENILELGFPGLDRLVTILPGDMFVLAGRPSHGKTAMAVSITLNICRGGGRVLFISGEMDVNQMTDRFVSAIADIPLDMLRRGVIQDVTKNPRVRALMTLESAIRIVFAPSSNDRDVARIVKQEVLEHGDLRLVVIDYLQIMKPAGRPQDRRIGIGNIANAIKNLAGEMRLPILLLSQLTRPQGQDRAKNKPPTLYDLKEAGEIENAADVVGLLHRVDVDKSMPEWGVDLMIEKNRNGPLGDVRLIMTRRTASFRESNSPPIAGADGFE